MNRTYNNIRVNDNDFQKYDPQPNCPRPSRIESNRLKDIQSEILQHLLKEEDILYKYATESTQEIQRSENCLKNNNQLSNRSNNRETEIHSVRTLAASLIHDRKSSDKSASGLIDATI